MEKVIKFMGRFFQSSQVMLDWRSYRIHFCRKVYPIDFSTTLSKTWKVFYIHLPIQPAPQGSFNKLKLVVKVDFNRVLGSQMPPPRLEICATSLLKPEENPRHLNTDVNLLQQLKRSQFVVDLYEVQERLSKGKGKKFLKFMELGLYDLQMALFQEKKYSMVQILTILIHIANGLFHTHTQGIIHGDLKEENIVFFPNGIWKIIDFNSSKDIKDQSPDLRAFGTYENLSPEVLNWNFYNWLGVKFLNTNTVSQACDIWSFGCLVCNIVPGLPMPNWIDYLKEVKNIIEFVSNTNKNLPNKTQEEQKKFKSMVSELIIQMKKIPSKIQASHAKFMENLRPKEIEWHALLEKCFQWDPKKRSSIEDINKFLHDKQTKLVQRAGQMSCNPR